MRVEGGGILFWGPIFVIPMWVGIFYLCSLCTGCATLPANYPVYIPIYRTQDAMYRLPYREMTQIRENEGHE